MVTDRAPDGMRLGRHSIGDATAEISKLRERWLRFQTAREGLRRARASSFRFFVLSRGIRVAPI